MLKTNIEQAKVKRFLDEIISLDEIKVYKPDPRAYEHAMKKLNLKKNEILYVALGGWDVYGAKTFGYKTYWLNRTNAIEEVIGKKADGSSIDFEGLIKFASIK